MRCMHLLVWQNSTSLLTSCPLCLLILCTCSVTRCIASCVLCLTQQLPLQYLRNFDAWLEGFGGYQSHWFLAYIMVPELRASRFRIWLQSTQNCEQLQACLRLSTCSHMLLTCACPLSNSCSFGGGLQAGCGASCVQPFQTSPWHA